MQIRRIEAILQTKFLIEESNVESLLSTVPVVKLDAADANDEKKECVAEDEVDLVFKNEGSDDDLSSDEDENTEI